MKITRVIFIFLISLCLSFITTGQSRVGNSNTHTEPKKEMCESNEISFPCPNSFIQLFKDEKSGLLLFRNKSLKSLGVFVVVTSPETNKSQVLNEAKKNLIEKLYPEQSQSYDWKSISLTFFGEGKPMSKFDVSFGAEKGYNENQLLFFNFRQIIYNGKSIYVGYIYEHPSGIDAKQGFEMDFGDSLYNSCSAQIKLIYSITGEEIAKDTVPCSIMGDRPND